MKATTHTPDLLEFRGHRMLWSHLALTAVSFALFAWVEVQAARGWTWLPGSWTVTAILFGPGCYAKWRPRVLRLDRASGWLYWSGAVSFSESAGRVRLSRIQDVRVLFDGRREYWTPYIRFFLREPRAEKGLWLKVREERAREMVNEIHRWLAASTMGVRREGAP